MLKIIGWKYGDNTATFQRMWGIAKALAERGECVEFIFLMPNDKIPLPSNQVNLKCLCLGDFNLKNKYVVLFFSLCKLLAWIKKGDTVLYYTFYPALFVLSLIPRLNLLIENNEYPPFVARRTVLKKKYISLFLKMVRRSQKVFVISRNLKDYFVEVGVEESKIQILNMTVDLGRFTNVKKNKVERYIAYCGTVTLFKDGVDVLLKAFALVASKIDDVKLYIIGRIPYERDRMVIENIIAEKGLSEKIRMIGMASSDILVQYLADAEILALSRPDNIQAYYGFPTKLGEYLATGNPVVVTRVGNIDEFLVDKESCLFARPDSIEDFADKLLWLLGNPEKGRKIGARGKLVAEKNFNAYVESKKIEDVLWQNG